MIKVLGSKITFLLVTLMLCSIALTAQEDNTNKNKFRQLGQELPTPNVYRNASGAPGHMYWQQKADYKMKIEIDDKEQKLYGEETITYTNNSPDELEYLWLQLDQNVRALDSDSKKITTGTIDEKMSMRALSGLYNDFDGGFKIEKVTNEDDSELKHVINKTMMRVDMAENLAPGESFTFNIKWWYNINDRMQIGGRSGYEYFEEDENYLYTIAQYFPRMCVYDEVNGWQNKQFLGRGEFALTFGDYEVEITVPSDHAVASTGVLQNPDDVLSAKQKQRLEKAEDEFEQPVIIITQDEAEEKEGTKSNKKSTWVFKAENVRDFAFASSRKFIWDAMAVKQSDGSKVMAMSMYPKEGNPLWEQYSTKAVAHTLKWYSHYTFDYPYPVAWSINAARIGMEYPMICFNFGRVEEDGTYTARTKYGMIGVIIHEVGHNYFPMIVNSDERQWTWMDEGLNTFCQFLTEQEWERDYPSRRGHAHKIVDYMKGDKSNISPIMTNSESIHQFGNNAYGKPATALNILRETVMGRELFDHAFKTYSHRWMFKHPSPADFFRTMEDASAVDLDWYWRGWFYTTDHCDISLDNVRGFQMNSKKPEDVSALLEKEKKEAPVPISSKRNKEKIKQTYDEQDRSLRDFYTDYDPSIETVLDKDEYKKYYDSLSDKEKAVMNSGANFYELSFTNKGGLVMPIILQLNYADGSNEIMKIPAEIWRRNSEKVSKVIKTDKQVTQVILDPFLETADTDTSNNYFPPQAGISRFELFKQNRGPSKNPMQKANEKKKKGAGTN